MADPRFGRVVHHVDGPVVRLGIGWFALSLAAAALSTLALAIVMAVAAALAADELVRLHGPWRRRPLLEEPPRLVAVLGAAALPLAASAGGDTLTAALAFLVVVTLAAAIGIPSDPPLVAQGLPLLAALGAGLTAASPVLVSRLGTWAAIVIVLLIGCYDAADFIVGTGSGTSWEGPVAGALAVGVFGFACVVIGFEPLRDDGAAALTLIVALLAPLGPPITSVLIGDSATKARFVRRLDSLLVAGPVAAFALAALLPGLAR